MKRVRTREASSDQFGFAVVGDLGAMEFWMFTDHPDLGGVEAHRRDPSEYQDDRSKHDDCPLLDGAPCWHDGTSLWASEHWIPLYQQCGEEWVWAELEARYQEFMAS